MKKIINGRKYDTETAAVIGSSKESNETLYRKRTGEYFMYWDGWGEEIIPMNVKDAQDWAERHMDAEAYEMAFGPVSEDAADVMISAKLPAAVDAKLRRLAAESQTSVTAILINLIENA